MTGTESDPRVAATIKWLLSVRGYNGSPEMFVRRHDIQGLRGRTLRNLIDGKASVTDTKLWALGRALDLPARTLVDVWQGDLEAVRASEDLDARDKADLLAFVERWGVRQTSQESEESNDSRKVTG